MSLKTLVGALIPELEHKVITTHPLFLGACPHQTGPVLDMVVTVVLLGTCNLLPLFPQSILGRLLLLDTLFEVPLEDKHFSLVCGMGFIKGTLPKDVSMQVFCQV